MKLRSVGLRRLKTNISEYMAQVKEGNTIIVTVRGKKVGRITPIHQKPSTDPAVDSGQALWNGKKFLPRVQPARRKTRDTITDILLENRK